jgi:hypothetical protein
MNKTENIYMYKQNNNLNDKQNTYEENLVAPGIEPGLLVL